MPASKTSQPRRLMPPTKAIAILTKIINEAAWLQSEAWASPKRTQWHDTAKGALERTFGVGHSLVQSFNATQTFVLGPDDSDEQLRQHANSILDSSIAVLRSGIEQLGWEAEEEDQATRSEADRTSESMQVTKNDAGLSPQGILKAAIKAVPAVKYALGIAGIISVLAIIKGFNLDFRIAALGTVIMFVLMTVLVIFARLTSIKASILMVPAQVFTWFALLMTIATATLLFTSVFLRWPVNLEHWLTGVDSDGHNRRSDAGLVFSSPSPGESFKQGCVISARGIHTVSPDGYVWIFLRDAFGGYYIESPRVDLREDGRWEATNIQLGSDIRSIVAIQVDGRGNDMIEKWIGAQRFGAIEEKEIKNLSAYRELKRVAISSSGTECPLELKRGR